MIKRDIQIAHINRPAQLNVKTKVVGEDGNIQLIAQVFCQETKKALTEILHYDCFKPNYGFRYSDPVSGKDMFWNAHFNVNNAIKNSTPVSVFSDLTQSFSYFVLAHTLTAIDTLNATASGESH